MKIRLARIIGIPVPEQFRKDWQPIVHKWIEEYNDQYPDDIIEHVEPCEPDYYREYLAEYLPSDFPFEKYVGAYSMTEY